MYSATELDLLGYKLEFLTTPCIKADPARFQPLINLPVPSTKNKLKLCLEMFAYYARWIENFFTKIAPLTEIEMFLLTNKAVSAFETLRSNLSFACLHCINDEETFTVECDGSDLAIGATLNQNGCPIVFMSLTLTKSKRRYLAIEKEATAIIEAVRKWVHFLHAEAFTLVTDQQSIDLC